MLFHTAKIECSSNLSYQYDGNEQTRIAMCSRAHPWVKALFARCGGLVLPPLNNMEVPTHFRDGRTMDNIAKN